MNNTCQHEVLVEGEILSGSQLREYANKHGLCTICAATRTHRKAGSLINRSWAPFSAVNENGEYIVYKGYCLQPTCYTLAKAQQLLGERTPNKKKRRGRRRRRSTQGPISRGVANGHSSSALSSSTLETSSDTLKSSTRSFSDDSMESYSGIEPYRSAYSNENLSTDEEEVSDLTQSPTTLLLQHLEDASWDADATTILQVLDQHGSDQEIAEAAFSYLRKTVVFALNVELVYEETSVVLDDQDWMRVLKSKTLEHLDDAETGVMGESLATIMTFAALSEDLAQTIVNNGGIELLVAILKVRKDSTVTKRRCCGALECLTAVTDTSNWESEVVGKLVVALVRELQSVDIPTSHYSARAIYNLGQDYSQDRWEVIRKALSTGHSLASLWELLDSASLTEQVGEGVLFLLWQLAVQGQENVSELSREDLISVLRSLSDFVSPCVHEAALGILSLIAVNTGTLDCSDLNFIASCTCKSLKTFQDEEGVQIQGIGALWNLVKNLSVFCAPFAAEEEMVILAVRAMERFPQNPILQEMGCHLFVVVVNKNDGSISAAMSRAVSKTAREAFQKHLVDSSFESESQRHSIKSATTAALVSLSACGTTAADLFDSNLVADVDKAMKGEKDPLLLASLLRIIINLSPYWRESGLLSTQEGASEDIVPIELFKRTIETLECIGHSPEVAKDGCLLLAILYEMIPCHEFLGQSSFVSLGPSKVSIGRQCVREFDAILNAMTMHQENAGIQKVCCTALSNFLTSIVHHWMQPNGSLTSEKSDETAKLASKVMQMLPETMQRHRSDKDVQISVIHLFQAIVFLANREELQQWSPRIVDGTIEALEHFDGNGTLQSTAFDTFAALLTMDENRDKIGSSRCAYVLARALQGDEENLVLRACRVLAIVVKGSIEVSDIIAETMGAHQAILSCMEKTSASVESQRHLCSLVESQVVLQDHRVRHEIANSGWTAIVTAVDLHRQDASVVESSCRALVGLVADVDADILWGHRVALSEAVLDAIKLNEEYLDVELAIADLLLSLCTKEEYFRGLLWVSDAVPILAASATTHLTSTALLKSIFATLRMIAEFGDKTSIIGESTTIGSILNGVLFHAESIELVLEGLKAMRCIASDSSTKKSLKELKTEHTIICLMRVNIWNPEILAEAFATLNNVAVDQNRGGVSRIRDGVLDIVLTAMSRNQEHELVQKNACLLLSSYTYSQRSLQKLRGTSQTLIPLLMSAAEKFPIQCSGRAQHIMDNL